MWLVVLSCYDVIVLRSAWHQIAGKYDPVDRWVSLDYKTIFLDPTLAELVFFHENTHKLLCQTTEYGQAQATIVGLIPEIRTLSNQEAGEIQIVIMKNSKSWHLFWIWMMSNGTIFQRSSHLYR